MLMNDAPFELPSTHETFGSLVHASWTTVSAANSAKNWINVLLILGGLAILTGVVLWLAMNLMIAGLVAIGVGIISAGIGGILFADYVCYPPAIVGAYEEGVAVANVGGIIFESTFDKMCKVKFQEFYEHRFADLELSGKISPPGNKTVLVNKNCQGEPQQLIKYLERKGVMRIETWQQVLKRTGG